MTPSGSDPVVAVLPVLGVEDGHVAEARRALLAQGRALDDDDDAVTALLWAARCLPAALDALADAHSPVPLAAAKLAGAQVDAGVVPPHAILVAVARVEDDAVVVEVIERRLLLAAEADDAVPCCLVTFPFQEEAKDAVPVHRFTLGPVV